MSGVAERLSGATPLLQVFDMPRSIAFYRDALGFRLVATSEPGERFDWAMLQGGPLLGGALHAGPLVAGAAVDAAGFGIMLNTAYEADERPPAPDPARVAAHADTTIYFRCDDPDAIYAELRDRGLAPSAPATAPYGMRQVYLKDPDGYELCFQSPVESDESKAAS